MDIFKKYTKFSRSENLCVVALFKKKYFNMFSFSSYICFIEHDYFLIMVLEVDGFKEKILCKKLILHCAVKFFSLFFFVSWVANLVKSTNDGQSPGIEQGK